MIYLFLALLYAVVTIIYFCLLKKCFDISKAVVFGGVLTAIGFAFLLVLLAYWGNQQ